jgi:predicted small lipoprotein YifL
MIAGKVTEIRFIDISHLGTSAWDRPAHREVPAKLFWRRARYTLLMKIARPWALVFLVGMLTGCGQKGPLVHPDAPKHKKTVPSTPAPAAPAPAAPAPAPAGTPANPTP